MSIQTFGKCTLQQPIYKEVVMSKRKQRRKCRHFTLDDRMNIASGLSDGLSIRDIAYRLDVSPSSVSREISRNLTVSRNPTSICPRSNKCAKKDLCNKGCVIRCKDCTKVKCISVCPDYPALLDECPKGLAVCNSCRRKGSFNTCGYTKRLYLAKTADKMAASRASDTRKGFNLTGEQFSLINEVASPLLLKGQSPYTIISNHPELDISVQTLYRLVECGELSADNFSLRTKLSRKPRKGFHPRRATGKILAKLKEGRRYEDYLKFMETYDGPVVQMDTVIGKQDEGACLLTLHMPEVHFQIAMILDTHTSGSVVNAFDTLETVLGCDLFKTVFPVILTDNGPEFTDITGMERSCIDPSAKRTHIFFCDPNRSDQKGSCENNHKHIRYVIPKGTSMEPYMQEDINLMMCHINSYARKSLYGKTPFQAAKNILPEDFFLLMGYEEITANGVNLTPSLLKSRISQR